MVHLICVCNIYFYYNPCLISQRQDFETQRENPASTTAFIPVMEFDIAKVLTCSATSYVVLATVPH